MCNVKFLTKNAILQLLFQNLVGNFDQNLFDKQTPELTILTVHLCILVWELYVNCHRFHCTKNEVFHYGYLEYMWPNPQFLADFVTFTEEIRNKKLLILCSVHYSIIVFPSFWQSIWSFLWSICSWFLAKNFGKIKGKHHGFEVHQQSHVPIG